MTLTTCDEDQCRIIEPHVCTTSRRAQVLEIMRDEGIPAIIDVYKRQEEIPCSGQVTR